MLISTTILSADDRDNNETRLSSCCPLILPPARHQLTDRLPCERYCVPFPFAQTTILILRLVSVHSSCQIRENSFVCFMRWSRNAVSCWRDNILEHFKAGCYSIKRRGQRASSEKKVRAHLNREGFLIFRQMMMTF